MLRIFSASMNLLLPRLWTDTEKRTDVRTVELACDSRRQEVVRVRCIVFFWGTEYRDIPAARLAEALAISKSSAARSRERGVNICEQMSWEITRFIKQGE